MAALLYDRSFAPPGSDAEAVFVHSQGGNSLKRKRVDSDAKVAHIHFTSEQGTFVNEVWVYSQTTNSGFSLLIEDPTLELNALQAENNELFAEIKPLEEMAAVRGIALEELVSNILHHEEEQDRVIEEQGRVIEEQGRVIIDLQRAKANQGHVIEEQGRVILNLQSTMARQENLLAKFQIALDAALSRLPPLDT